jgi:hypothetical protein
MKMAVSRRLFVFAASATALMTTSADATLGDALNGMWQGSLTQLDGPGLSPPGEAWQPFRILIDRNRVQVFLRKEDGTAFDEMKPGDFRIERLGNSAVIHALDASAAGPLGTGWVESWTISVTLSGQDTLACVFARQVNNHQLRPDQEGAIFSMLLSGELQRIHLDHV